MNRLEYGSATIILSVVMGAGAILSTLGLLVRSLPIKPTDEKIGGCIPCGEPPECFPGDPCADCG